jgi:hypothetical protein
MKDILNKIINIIKQILNIFNIENNKTTQQTKTQYDYIFKYINKICDLFPVQNNFKSKIFLLEIAFVESKIIFYNPMQIDKIAFLDVQNRTSNQKKIKILNNYNINIDDISYEEIKKDVFLNVLFARLFLLLIHEKIPNNTSDRAKYWKKYYNTSLGQGTPEKYLNDINSQQFTKIYFDFLSFQY